MRHPLSGVVAVIVLSLAGCGKPADGPPTIPATGRATFDTKPAAGALLLFHTQGSPSALPSRAAVGPDGRFSVSTNGADDGLPKGDYVVTVEWRAGADENGAARPSVVPDKYTRKESSPLRATVRRGADGACDLGTISMTK